MTAIDASQSIGKSFATAESKKSAPVATTVETQDRFLKLLVTQMKNQDPLNPMDNAQVTSQLAQLSTVSGIDKLNSTLEALKSNYQSSQSLQAASMIGHTVVTPGSSITLEGGKGAMEVDLPQPVDSLNINVLDGAGKLIRTIDVGQHEAGIVKLAWDGKNDQGNTVSDGAYSFAVEAKTGGVASDAAPLMFAHVQSVSSNGQGTHLNFENAPSVDVSAVREFL